MASSSSPQRGPKVALTDPSGTTSALHCDTANPVFGTDSESPAWSLASEATPLLHSAHSLNKDEDYAFSDPGSSSPIRGARGTAARTLDDESYEAYMKAFKTRLRYYVPVIGWLPNYKFRKYLQSDLMAGITVAFLLVPQGLSYSQALVKLPPVHGLYTSCIPLFVYALLGTSRQLGMGPEALISMLVGATIREYASSKAAHSLPDLSIGSLLSKQEEAVGIATLLCLMVGIFTFLLGFFRLGFLDSVLSRALLRGFVLAVAIVVMIDMSETLLGIVPPINQCGQSNQLPAQKPEGESPIHKLLETLSRLGDTHLLTSFLSVGSISFLLGMKFVKKKFKKVRWLQVVPEILLLVVFTTALSKYFAWDCKGVAILNVKGLAHSNYEYPKIPSMSLSKIKSLMLSAILISVIGFVESIVAAKTYATRHNYSVSPNRELVAIGFGNIIGAIFGAFPAFGSLGRSAVNDTAGARTQMAGFFTGAAVLCTTIWLLPLFEFLPKAVCSSIIVVAALKLIELDDVYFILRMRAWKDLGLLLMTFFTTIVLSIESGTLLSVGVSLLLVVKHTTKTRLAVMGRTMVVDPATGATKIKYRSISDSDKVQRIDDALIIRVEEGLFFGNSGQLKDRLKRIEMYGDLGVHPGEEPRRTPAARRRSREASAEAFLEEGQSTTGNEENIRAVVFDFGAVTDIDASATLALLEIVEDYTYRNMEVCFVKLRESCKNPFLRSGIYHLVGPSRFFRKVRDATNYLKSTDRCSLPRSSPGSPPMLRDHDHHEHPIAIEPASGGGVPDHHQTEWTIPNRTDTFPAGSYFASYMEQGDFARRNSADDDEDDVFEAAAAGSSQHAMGLQGSRPLLGERKGTGPFPSRRSAGKEERSPLMSLFDEQQTGGMTTDSDGQTGSLDSRLSETPPPFRVD
ncbi:Solute carrier 26 [Thoreauomyces humboldtii]|nr:Solute carrier 26 [Thoreauomyces humboldtii]